MMDQDGDIADVDLMETHGLGDKVHLDFFNAFEDLFDERDMERGSVGQQTTSDAATAVLVPNGTGKGKAPA